MVKLWKVKVVEGIRNGKNIIEIMDELKMFPYGLCLLNIIRELKADGIPKEILERVIEQAKPEIGEKFTENLKKEI